VHYTGLNETERGEPPSPASIASRTTSSNAGSIFVARPLASPPDLAEGSCGLYLNHRLLEVSRCKITNQRPWEIDHDLALCGSVLVGYSASGPRVGPITGVFEPPPPHATYQPPNHTPSTDTGAESQGA
jgi:hypothetical protein